MVHTVIYMLMRFFGDPAGGFYGDPGDGFVGDPGGGML